MMVDGECGAVGGMSGRGNRSARRKPAPIQQKYQNLFNRKVNKYRTTQKIYPATNSIEVVLYDAVDRNKVSIRQFDFIFFHTHYMFRPLQAIFR
jgi:hypothetical protein